MHGHLCKLSCPRTPVLDLAVGIFHMCMCQRRSAASHEPSDDSDVGQHVANFRCGSCGSFIRKLRILVHPCWLQVPPAMKRRPHFRNQRSSRPRGVASQAQAPSHLDIKLQRPALAKLLARWDPAAQSGCFLPSRRAHWQNQRTSICSTPSLFGQLIHSRLLNQ